MVVVVVVVVAAIIVVLVAIARAVDPTCARKSYARPWPSVGRDAIRRYRSTPDVIPTPYYIDWKAYVGGVDDCRMITTASRMAERWSG
jgi:hypothetical protein